MTAAAAAGGARGGFDVRKISWKRAAWFAAVAFGGGSAALWLGDGVLGLRADGLVQRERVAAAAPYEARVRQILVRRGDRVRAGQVIAVLDSAAMARMLADLGAQKARLAADIARVEAKLTAAEALLPGAQMNAARMRGFADELERSRAGGAASLAYAQQIAASAYAADERLAGLRADQASAGEELRQIRAAFAEMQAAYDALRTEYDGGTLVAGADGYVGEMAAEPGEFLPSGGKVLEIYTGRPYVVAYLTDGAFADAAEGDEVRISTPRETMRGIVQTVMPIVGTAPPELQRQMQSGRIARIAFGGDRDLATNQKVRVSGCYLAGCRGIGDAVVSAARSFASGVTAAVRSAAAYAAERRIAAVDPHRTVAVGP